MHHNERIKALHKLLYSIIHEVLDPYTMYHSLFYTRNGVGFFPREALSKPCVFGIDDAHLVDTDSWEFIQDLALEQS